MAPTKHPKHQPAVMTTVDTEQPVPVIRKWGATRYHNNHIVSRDRMSRLSSMSTHSAGMASVIRIRATRMRKRTLITRPLRFIRLMPLMTLTTNPTQGLSYNYERRVFRNLKRQITILHPLRNVFKQRLENMTINKQINLQKERTLGNCTKARTSPRWRLFYLTLWPSLS